MKSELFLIIFCTILVSFITITPQNSYSQNYTNSKSLLAEAFINMEKYDYENAATYFDRVLEIEPDNVEALFNRGLIFSLFQQYKEAEYYYDRVLEIEPDNVDALVNKALDLSLSHKYEEAEYYYDRVLEIEPDNIIILASKADDFMSQQNYEEAIYYYDKVLEIEPDNVIVLSKKANFLLSQQNYEEAIYYYDKILKVDPSNRLVQQKAEKITKDLLKHIDYSKYSVNVQVEVRNQNNDLVAFFSNSKRIFYLPLSITEEFLNSISTGGIVKHLDSFDVIEVTRSFKSDKITFEPNVILSDTNTGHVIYFKAFFPGIVLKNGDSVVTKWTITRPVN